MTASLAAGTGAQAVDPVPNGRHRVSLRLHVRDVSIPGPQMPFIWVFAASPQTGWMFYADAREETFWLGPGEEADQIVSFDLARGARLARLRLGLQPASVDWVLS